MRMSVSFGAAGTPWGGPAAAGCRLVPSVLSRIVGAHPLHGIAILYKHPAFAIIVRYPPERRMDASNKGNASALSSEKAKALQAALAQIEKQFGKGSIMRLGDGEAIEDIQVVSTGSLGLDIALGVGGLPRGRVIEIYGPESSGKTTLTLQ